MPIYWATYLCGLATWRYWSVKEMSRALGSTTRDMKMPSCERNKTAKHRHLLDSTAKKYPRGKSTRCAEVGGWQAFGWGEALMASRALCG